MSPEIKAALITGISTLVAALIPITYLLIKNRNLSIGFKYIAPGMAVAYYYSFIERLSTSMNEKNDLYIKDGSNRIEINKTNTSIRVLIPNVLEKNDFTNSEKLIEERYNKGVLMQGEKILFRDIVYTREHNNAYLILDLPNILQSAAEYYQGSTRKPNFEISKRWKKLNKKELNNFKEIIIKIAENSRGFHNKIEVETIE